nr:type 1 glutamine amidotransferase [Desulfobulbaceae bacterium]
MPKRFLVFQHTASKKPGNCLLKSAKEQNVSLEIIKLWKNTIPAFNNYDGLLVLGRGPDLDQSDNYPFQDKEKEAIKRWVSEDRPFFGVGRGHQLLAEALGATVGENYCASIGFVDGYLTRKGKTHPLFNKIPHRITLFKWHRQAVMEPVPRNIDILATSAECQIEAISIKDRPYIVGIQFDNNASGVKDVETYLHKGRKWLASLNGKYINPSKIISDARKFEETLTRQYNNLFTNFIKLT